MIKSEQIIRDKIREVMASLKLKPKTRVEQMDTLSYRAILVWDFIYFEKLKKSGILTSMEVILRLKLSSYLPNYSSSSISETNDGEGYEIIITKTKE